jgi:hypothetical protein
MSRAKVVVPAALVHVKEMADAQVPEEKGERDGVEAVVVESVLLGMEDQRKHRKSLTRKWKITGEQRKMALMLLLGMLGLWMMSRWWNEL